jgi:hypothetical protein
VELDIAGAIKDFGFPIVAAMGMGYFIYFIWKWVTEVIDPVIGDATITLIGLVDRVRMLDNDMIRLNQKLAMVLEYKEEIAKTNPELADSLDNILKENRTRSQGFNSTGKE